MYMYMYTYTYMYMYVFIYDLTYKGQVSEILAFLSLLFPS